MTAGILVDRIGDLPILDAQAAPIWIVAFASTVLLFGSTVRQHGSAAQ